MNKNYDDDNKVRPGESGVDYWKRVSGSNEEPEPEQQPPEHYWNGFEDNGPRPMNDPDYGPIPEDYRSNGMSRAAMFCGIIALVTTFLGGGFFFALLAILFALLSARKKMSRQAKYAFAMGSVSLAVFVFTITMLVTTLVSNGSWSRLMEEARSVDFSDSSSVAAFQTEIYEAFLGSTALGSSEFGMNPILNPQNPNIDAGIRARENAKEAAKNFADSTTESTTAADSAATSADSAATSADSTTAASDSATAHAAPDSTVSQDTQVPSVVADNPAINL